MSSNELAAGGGAAVAIMTRQEAYNNGYTNYTRGA